eukprot:1544289-Rhodomonas_salina.3
MRASALLEVTSHTLAQHPATLLARGGSSPLATAAIRSGYCRPERNGMFSMVTCNSNGDGGYQNKEGCNAGCGTCTKTEPVPVVNCQPVPSIGTEFVYDLRCTATALGTELSRDRAAPSATTGVCAAGRTSNGAGWGASRPAPTARGWASASREGGQVHRER